MLSSSCCSAMIPVARPVPHILLKVDTSKMGGRIGVQIWKILKDLQLERSVSINIQRPDSTANAIPVRRVAKQ